jgi:ornithine cyclodeaminase/alanine dehydrogenase-like protein (mu-crystallin family)
VGSFTAQEKTTGHRRVASTAAEAEAEFFQSNGIADEDLAVGKYVLDQAKRKKLKLRKLDV